MSDSFRSELLGFPMESPDGVQPLADSATVTPTQGDMPDSGHSVEAGLPGVDQVSEAIDGTEVEWDGVPRADAQPTAEKRIPLLGGRRKGRRLVRRDDAPRTPFTPEQRLLILDSWQRSGLPAGDFAPLVGLSKHTLYTWKKQFDLHGPAGLMEQPRGVRTGSRLPEVTNPVVEAVASRLGLPADQRHAATGSGPAGQRLGGGPRAARSGL